MDFKISTKKDKNSAAVITNMTVNGGSAETWKALGMQALVVKVQGKFRKDGVIPSEFILNADEWAPGTRHTSEPMTPSQIAERAKVDPEFRKQILAEMGLEEGEEELPE